MDTYSKLLLPYIHILPSGSLKEIVYSILNLKMIFWLDNIFLTVKNLSDYFLFVTELATWAAAQVL